MIALAQLTIREAIARKTFVAFFICATILLLLLIFAFQVDIVQGNQALLGAFGEEIGNGKRNTLVDVEEMIKGFIAVSAGGLLTFGLFLSIFSTAGLIPSMLEKGSIDLILSKPISRKDILLGRSLGAMSIVFINIAYLILGIWLILGFKTGFWLFGLLWIIPLICLVFFIIFAWMVLFGILLQNSALTIMITYVLFALSGILLARDQIYALLSSKIWAYILDGLYYLIPRTSEMIAAPLATLKDGQQMNFESYITSLIVSLIVFYASIELFKRKDY